MEVFTEMNIASIASITVICYVIGEIIKLTPYNNNQYISVVCLVSGLILGLIGRYLGVDALVNMNIYDCLATGAVSGLGAVGVYEAIKNLT